MCQRESGKNSFCRPTADFPLPVYVDDEFQDPKSQDRMSGNVSKSDSVFIEAHINGWRPSLENICSSACGCVCMCECALNLFCIYIYICMHLYVGLHSTAGIFASEIREGACKRCVVVRGSFSSG